MIAERVLLAGRCSGSKKSRRRVTDSQKHEILLCKVRGRSCLVGSQFWTADVLDLEWSW